MFDQQSLAVDIEEVIGKEVLGRSQVAFAEAPIYLLREEGKSGTEKGWLYLTPFSDEVVAFSFDKRADGRTSFGTYVGNELSTVHYFTRMGSELLLQLEDVAFRDINTDGRWDLRYESKGEIAAFIRIGEHWSRAGGLPELVEGELRATASDGQIFRFTAEGGDWVPIEK